MSYLSNDYTPAFYRTRDPIDNFRIRVRLEQIGTNTNELPELTSIGSNSALQSQIEEYEFSWQEKVFSKYEFEKFSDEKNCSSVLENKYFKEIENIKKKNLSKPTNRLFSYVDHDNYTNISELNKVFTNEANYSRTALSIEMDTVKHRRGCYKSEMRQIVTTNIVADDPSIEIKKRNRLISSAYTTMYIMADVSPKTRPPEESDGSLLCVIKINSSGVLFIKPDFNKDKSFYHISNSTGIDFFKYTLTHSSLKLSNDEQDKEYKMYKEMYARHYDFLQTFVGTEFELPYQNDLRLIIFGEIVSAKNFEYGDLYIKWFLDPRDDWKPTYSMPLCGTTHRSITRSEGLEDVAYFSQPFFIDLTLNHYTRFITKNNDKEIHLPQIFIEICSLDSWNRYRHEGYSYFTLQLQPGRCTNTLNCWRPAGISMFSELRRYFIGCSPQLDNNSYIASPSSFNEPRLSRYGFKTVSAGQVIITTNTILQSQIFNQQKNINPANLMKSLGLSLKPSNIMNILEAFQKAKKRMMDARENLKIDFIEAIKNMAIYQEQ